MDDLRDTIQTEVHRLVGFGDGAVDLTRPPGDDGLFGPGSAPLGLVFPLFLVTGIW